MVKADKPLPKKQGVSGVTTEILLPAPRPVMTHPLPKKFDGNVSPESNTPETRKKGSF